MILKILTALSIVSFSILGIVFIFKWAKYKESNYKYEIKRQKLYNDAKNDIMDLKKITELVAFEAEYSIN